MQARILAVVDHLQNYYSERFVNLEIYAYPDATCSTSGGSAVTTARTFQNAPASAIAW